MTTGLMIILILIGAGLAWSTWLFKQKLTLTENELDDVKSKLAESEQQVLKQAQELERKKGELEPLTKQAADLENLLQEAAMKLASYEETVSSGKGDGLLEKAVQKLVGFGVPGLVLLVMIAIAGFPGAAAITWALAAIGGPGGMVAGVGVLIALGLVSDAVAKYGLPKIAESVIKGLISKGQSTEKIREQIMNYPSWIISQRLKDRLFKLLDDYDQGNLV